MESTRWILQDIPRTKNSNCGNVRHFPITFPGVILFASHDHQIVQTTANRIMEIMPNGILIDKITTYDEYLESDEMAKKRQSVYTMTEEDN